MRYDLIPRYEHNLLLKDLSIQVTDGLRKLDAVLEGSELKLQVQVQKMF